MAADDIGVLLISGSLQSASSNRAALDVIESHLSSRRAASVSWFDDLAEVAPFNPDNEADPGEAVLALRDALGGAAAVIVAAPEYAGALPGMLKNALEWIVGSAELYEKAVGVISSGTTGGEHARQQLVQTLTWQGAHVVATYGIAAPKTKTDESGVFTDSDTIAGLHTLADTVVRSISTDQTSPNQA